MAGGVDATGTPQQPGSTFHASSDRTVVAVLRLADLPAGTKLSYVRYLDDKFVDSKTSTLAKTSKSFFFTFTAQSGKNLATGHYRLRLYVNEQAAWEVLYQVI